MKVPKTWAIVLIASEPWPLIIAFVAHHLSLGASKIYLFLDEPDPKLVSLLRDNSKVDLQTCTKEFWQTVCEEGRPEIIQDRQFAIASLAYVACTCDWLAHIDCDEFLYFRRPVAKVLNNIPDDIDFIKLLVSEATGLRDEPSATIFDQTFRDPLTKKKLASEIYHEDAAFLKRGITGHAIGKSFFRTGRNISVGVHTKGMPSKTATTPKVKVKQDPTEIAEFAPRHRVLHFDGLTAKHFASKLEMVKFSPFMRYSRSPSRQNQIHFAKKNIDQPEILLEFHKRLKTISHEQHQKLMKAKAVRSIELGIESSIKSQFPDLDVDLSPENFDRILSKKLNEI